MAAFVSYGDISPRTNVYAAAKFLQHAVPKLVLERYATIPDSIPKNKTLTIKFRRCVPFDVTTTPLQEGVTPQPQAGQFEDVSTYLKQYGSWVQITDVIADTHEDPVLNKFSELCAEQAAQTREQLNWGVFQGGTSVYYSSTTASPTLRSQVNAPITLQLPRKVERFLDSQYATKFTKMLKPSPNYDTTAVPEAYVAICNTDLRADLYDMAAKFTPVEKYASGSPEPYEIGKAENCRYIASAFLKPFLGAGSSTLNGMTSVGGTNVDVYSILYVSQDALGVVPLRGMQDVEMGIRNPNKMGDSASDPLGQRGYVAWKMWHAALILNQNWVARVEVGATA